MAIVLDSTNKPTTFKFPLVFWGFENSTKKLVKLQCYWVQMVHLIPLPGIGRENSNFSQIPIWPLLQNCWSDWAEISGI